MWHTQTFCADACPRSGRFPSRAAHARRVRRRGATSGDAVRRDSGRTRRRGGKNANANAKPRAGASTFVSATALPRVGLSHGLWVDEGDEKPGGAARGGGVPGRAWRPRRERQVEQASAGGARTPADSFAVRSTSAPRPPRHSPEQVGEGGLGAGRRRDVLVSRTPPRFVVHIRTGFEGAAAAKMRRRRRSRARRAGGDAPASR